MGNPFNPILHRFKEENKFYETAADKTEMI